MRNAYAQLFSVLLACCTVLLTVPDRAHGAPLNDAAAAWDVWVAAVDEALVEAYGEGTTPPVLPACPEEIAVWHSDAAKALMQAAVESRVGTNGKAVNRAVATFRARAQQALVLEMTDAVRAGDVARAQVWRARLAKPRGTSSTQGALLLQTLPAGKNQRADAARELAREAITWQTTRARQLLDEAVRSTKPGQIPMPGRLAERLTEAATLADLPGALRDAAGLVTPATPTTSTTAVDLKIAAILAQPWADVEGATASLRRSVEAALPSLLTDHERARRERLLLKLVILVPREYAAGVRDGQVTVPLEYREASTFTAQARQFAGELAPLWLAIGDAGATGRQTALQLLDASLAEADALIARKAPASEVENALASARAALEGPLGVTLRRSGSTAEIVEEVLLETRSHLNASLAAALAGRWGDAERSRLEAYTTFDPDLEARLMPRDPQMAIDIERLLLDGIDQPGVKTLLDRRATGPELEAAYARVSDAMDKAGALLKSGIDPFAAAINAASIVLREGLEGLLVIVAILAGLRGPENRSRRRLMWLGVLASAGMTLVTYALSRTILAQLHAYAEIIEAVTALLAIGVLLLITNWLFQQVYWNQWVTTLKSQAVNGERPWQLVSVGFLIGYREGFETVLFLQSLVMDVGGGPVGIGVAVGSAILVAFGLAALVLGLKIPYFKLLLFTAALIGMVLIAFVGNGVRTMQTVGWLPVHRLADGSWPAWVGQWLGVYNTVETVVAQALVGLTVIGTWRVSRWRAKRAGEKRRQVHRAAAGPGTRKNQLEPTPSSEPALAG
jgi:high-affinity iron transporter